MSQSSGNRALFARCLAIELEGMMHCSIAAGKHAPAVVEQQVVLQPRVVALRPQVLRLAGRQPCFQQLAQKPGAKGPDCEHAADKLEQQQKIRRL